MERNMRARNINLNMKGIFLKVSMKEKEKYFMKMEIYIMMENLKVV